MRSHTSPKVLAITAAAFLAACASWAQEARTASEDALAPAQPSATTDAAPVPTRVMTRDAEGRASIRAVRLPEPLRVDGALDESFYSTVPGMSDFVQVEPELGAPATEKTEVWLSFDDRNVYVSFRCWDTYPDRRVATEMRRDGQKIFQGDDIAYIFLDTFHDQRNGMTFSINSLGGLNDGQVTNDQYQGDWNAVFNLRTGTFEGGWTLEVAIPFRSIRYGAGASQTWGFNALRTVRWRNEFSVLSPVPQWNGLSAARQGRFAATVTGIEVPPSGRNLELKPYAIASLTSDAISVPQRRNDADGDAGLDVKYNISQNVVADFTYNTDFAQVEADEQQINLTRFNLFFPEKREFFLENQGTFTFGGAATSGQSDTPLLFYSRRIGLDGGQPVKIHGGGRLTGRVGRFTFGAIDIVTEGSAASPRSTNFSVARIRRDLFRRSTVGMMFAGRTVGQAGGDANRAFGVDGTFNFFNFLTINSYWAGTRTAGRTGGDTSYRGHLNYAGDRYGAQLEHLSVGRNFNPEVGFVRRTDIRKSIGQFRFSPRSRSIRSVRKFSYTASFTYTEEGGRVQNRQIEGEYGIEFQNADRLSVSYADIYELVPRPFRLSPTISVPVGGYAYETLSIGYNLGTQRLVAANLLVETGRFYGGRRSSLSIGRGRLNLGPQFSIEPTYTANWIDLPQASFTSHLAGSRVTYTVTPRMFASALQQYNSLTNTVATNARLRWEYRPGSELFVVYNDERDTGARGFPDLNARALIVKVNRLLRP